MQNWNSSLSKHLYKIYPYILVMHTIRPLEPKETKYKKKNKKIYLF